MILAYHRVNPWHGGADALTVSPGEFERQVKYLLGRKFKSVNPPDYFPVSSKKAGAEGLLITFDDGYADNLWYAMPVLKKYGIAPVIFLTVNYIGTRDLFGRYKDSEKDRFLNWREVKEMSAEGVVFGSHTLSHPHLPQLSEDRLDYEISESKKIIEDNTGKEAGIFCYPYGDFDERVIDAVRKAGYKGAVVTPGVRRRIKRGDYAVPRTGIYGHNGFPVFRMKIWKDYLTERYF